MRGAAKDPPKDTPPSAEPAAHPRAIRRPATVVIFLLAAAAGVAADLWSKHAVFADLLSQRVLDDPAMQRRGRELKAYFQAQPRFVAMSPDEREAEVLSAVLRSLDLHRPAAPGLELSLSTNPGVVFGLSMPAWAVLIATGVTIVLVGYFFAVSEAGARWVHAAWAMILAGAVGNLYDRAFAAVRLPGIDTPVRGQVRDFIDCSEIRVFGLNYPFIFNVADALLVAGFAILIVCWWRAARQAKRAEPARRRRPRSR